MINKNANYDEVFWVLGDINGVATITAQYSNSDIVTTLTNANGQVTMSTSNCIYAAYDTVDNTRVSSFDITVQKVSGDLTNYRLHIPKSCLTV